MSFVSSVDDEDHFGRNICGVIVSFGPAGFQIWMFSYNVIQQGYIILSIEIHQLSFQHKNVTDMRRRCNEGKQPKMCEAGLQMGYNGFKEDWLRIGYLS